VPDRRPGGQLDLGPDAWLVQPNPPPVDTDPADLEWCTPRRHPQPRKTFEQPVRLTGAIDRLPRAYIYCLRVNEYDTFGQFAARAKSEDGWQYAEIDATHNPHITAPHALLEMLLRLAAA